MYLALIKPIGEGFPQLGCHKVGGCESQEAAEEGDKDGESCPPDNILHPCRFSNSFNIWLNGQTLKVAGDAKRGNSFAAKCSWQSGWAKWHIEANFTAWTTYWCKSLLLTLPIL